MNSIIHFKEVEPPGEPRLLREQRMRIYIDEGGTFQVAQGRDRLFSVVAALVIPAFREADLFYQFLRLRDQSGISSVEIKGRELDETQISQVIELLASQDGN
jgi:hypothetical protein